MIPTEKLPDWRLLMAASTEDDHLIVLLTELKSTLVRGAFLPVPSPYLIPLQGAVRAARHGKAIRNRIVSAGKDKHGVLALELSEIFDYFEFSMQAVLMSYQAVEGYANQVIANGGRDTFLIQREDGDQEWDVETVQRRLPTEEKLATILPIVLGVTSPKGLAIWGQFKALKRLRDAVTHTKSYDAYRSPGGGADTIWHHLLDRDPSAFPTIAVDVMRHFAGPDVTWIDHADRLLHELR